MKKLIFNLLLVIPCAINAQLNPVITSWILNTTNSKGYGGIPSNIQTVQYSATQVYVSSTCIPGYNIGPWPSNPNTPSNQNFVHKFTLSPQQNTSTATVVGLGSIGVWSNGVSIFNAKDGMSYNNAGVWNRNALYYEGVSFDECLGHPSPSGEYHHHVNPDCLYDDKDSTHHSPIIGYAYDGFPVYGAYAYSNTNGTGTIKRMKSSYVLSTSTTRTNGPAVSTTYPAGCFVEDYYFVANSGDLDVHNGRFCITPEYPSGIYAYFVTINDTLAPVYPFVLGPTYYGKVQTGNTGPSGGHITITEATTVYKGTSSIDEIETGIQFKVMPNPTSEAVYLYMNEKSPNNLTANLYDASGQLLETLNNIQPSITYIFDLNKYAAGLYFLHLQNNNQRVVQKIIRSTN